MRLLTFSAVVLVCVLVQAIPATALELDAGTEFFVAFPDTVQFERREDPGRYIDTFALVVYAEYGAYVTIAGPGSYLRTVNISPDEHAIIYLDDADAPAPRIVADSLGHVTDDAFHVLATSPITVSAWMYTMAGADAWSVPPVSAWGTRYAINAAGPAVQWMPDSSSGRLQGRTVILPAGVVVVASEDGTSVSLPGAEYGQTSTYLLNRGQALSVAWSSFRREKRIGSPFDDLYFVDLTSAIVESDKPVVVTTSGYATILPTHLPALPSSVPDLAVNIAATPGDRGDFFVIPNIGQIDALDAFPPRGGVVERRLANRTLSGKALVIRPNGTDWTMNLEEDSVLIWDLVDHSYNSMTIGADGPIECILHVQRDSRFLYGGGAVRVPPTSSWTDRAVLRLPDALVDSNCRIAVVGIGQSPPDLKINGVTDDTAPWTQARDGHWYSSRTVRPGDRIDLVASGEGAVWGYAVGGTGGYSKLDASKESDTTYSIQSWFGTVSRGHAIEFSRLGVARASARHQGLETAVKLRLVVEDRKSLHLRLGRVSGRAQLHVYDLLGRQVKEVREIVLSEGEASVHYDFLDEGCFLVRLTSAFGAWSSSIMVEP